MSPEVILYEIQKLSNKKEDKNYLTNKGDVIYIIFINFLYIVDMEYWNDFFRIFSF